MKFRDSQAVKKKIALSLILAAVPLSLWSLTYSEPYRDWRWRRASLPEMQRTVRQTPNDAVLLYRLGVRLNDESRYPEALPFLERAVGLSLDRADYRDAWARALLATGQISQAFALLSQYTQTYPDSAEGHLYLGRFYVAQNANRRACQELELAARLRPGLTEAWWLQAVAHQAQNEIGMALTKIRTAVKQAPENPTYQALLGELLLASGDKPGALTAFDAALQRDPQLIAAQIFRARILLEDNRPGEALTAIDRTLTLDAKNGVAQLLRGRALLALRRPAEALPALEQAASLSPNDPTPADLLRRTLSELNRPADAQRWGAELQKRAAFQARLRAGEDALLKRPDDAKAARDLARLWAGQGDVTLTVRYCAKALKASQDAPPALIAAANDLTAAGFPDSAVELLKRVQAQTTLNPASFEAMGDALLAKGLVREAALQYETAARWMPQKRDDYKSRLDAFFARQAAHPSEAMRLYARAVSSERSRLGPQLSTEATAESLRKAVALEPKNAQIRRELVRVLFERRKRAEATKEASALLELSPDDTATHARLALLLLDAASTEEELNVVQFHLNKAKADTVMAPLVYYGAGLLAMRRHQNDVAVAALRAARRLAPDSDPICYALAQAERANGDEKEAQRLLAEYQRSRAEKQAEVDLLNRISDAPNEPERYREALAFYRKRGMEAQGAAIHQEMRRRFGNVN